MTHTSNAYHERVPNRMSVLIIPSGVRSPSCSTYELKHTMATDHET